MRSIFLLLFCSGIFFSHCGAQPKLFVPYKDGPLWGFSDINAKILIEPKYKDLRHFYNGLANIVSERGQGLIDTNGIEVLSPIYYEYTQMRFGFFGVRENSKQDWALFKAGDEQLTDFTCHSIEQTIGGFIVSSVTEGKIGSRTKRDFNYGVLRYRKDIGIDTLIPFNYASIRWDDRNQQFAARKNKTKFFFTNEGVPKGQADEETELRYEIDPIARDNPDRPSNTPSKLFEQNGKYGYLLKTDNGKYDSIPPIYDSIKTSRYGKGLFVKLKNKWGFLDNKGKQLVPTKYSSIDFKNERSFGIVHQKEVDGKIINETFYSTFFFVQNKKHWGAIVQTNESPFRLAIPCKYDKIQFMHAHYFLLHKRGYTSVVDYQNGKTIIPHGKYKKLDTRLLSIQGTPFIQLFTEDGSKVLLGFDGTEYFKKQVF